MLRALPLLLYNFRRNDSYPHRHFVKVTIMDLSYFLAFIFGMLILAAILYALWIIIPYILGAAVFALVGYGAYRVFDRAKK